MFIILVRLWQTKCPQCCQTFAIRGDLAELAALVVRLFPAVPARRDLRVDALVLRDRRAEVDGARAWVERFDRRGTEPFEPFEPFEFFQNSGIFPRKFKNFRKFQH